MSRVRDAARPAATPRDTVRTQAGGVDHQGLTHLLGYMLTLADIPARHAFARHVGQPLVLRPVEFSILVLVAFNPGATQTQIAQALSIAAPNLTTLLDRLAQRGLLERVRSASDRRAQTIHLTPRGRRLAERAHAVSLTMEQDLLAPLSSAERRTLLELLGRVAGSRADADQAGL